MVVQLVLQLLASGLVAGCQAALLGAGFGLIFSTARVFHFAHGTVYMCAAYVAWALIAVLDFGFVVGVAGSLAAAAMVGALMEAGVYRLFRDLGSPPRVFMLVSLALMILIENVVVILCGSQIKTIQVDWARTIYEVGPIVLTRLQIIAVTLAVAVLAMLVVYLRRTKGGWAMMAMTADPELAETVGVRPQRVRVAAFLIGSTLAGLGGLIQALDSGLSPTMGFNATLLASVAVIVGGIGSITGAAFGGLLIGLLQNLSVIWIGSAWQSSVAFGLLVVVILVRPRGLLVR